MLIVDQTEYENFKLKYKIDNFTEVDNTVMQLWLIGNEVINFKETSSCYYFCIAIGKQGADEKYREVKYVKYDSDVAKIVDEENFKMKNLVVTENRDLLNSLFKHFTK